MTTELCELNHGSTNDTDLSPPGPEKIERARDNVVRAWSIERKRPTSRFWSHWYLTGEERYDLDPVSWRHFDRALSGDAYVYLARLLMAFPTDMAEKADRRRRYAKLSSLLDEWANDESGFDEQVVPLIEEALRDASPRHFSDK